MEKQDILEKSRREKTDEGVAYAENEGRRYGEISFCLLIIAVLVYDFAKGLDNYLPMSLLWAYLAAQALGKYQARRERRFLWGIVFGAVASRGRRLPVLPALLCAADLVRGGEGLDEQLVLKNRLKVARAEKGLSQGDLAQLVGVSRQTISSIETGQFNPTAKLALILCIALDKKFEDLFYF